MNETNKLIQAVWNAAYRHGLKEGESSQSAYDHGSPRPLISAEESWNAEVETMIPFSSFKIHEPEFWEEV